jgi:hypothetical protein
MEFLGAKSKGVMEMLAEKNKEGKYNLPLKRKYQAVLIVILL